MRVSLPVVLIVLCAGALIWFAFGGDQTGDGARESDLVAGPEAPEAPKAPEPRERIGPDRDGSGLAPVDVTRVDEIPAGIAAHLENAGETLFEDQDLREQIVRFEIDPSHIRFLTGEDLLRSISELRGVDKALRFLKNEDLEKFRKHVFAKVVEPRCQAGELIDLLHPMGFRAVAWEGEFYVVPHGGNRLESAPTMDPMDPRNPRKPSDPKDPR